MTISLEDIPVYVLTEEMELPTEGMYYVVAGNGIFLHKDNGLVYTTIPVQNIAILPDFIPDTNIGHRFPKIPLDISHTIKTFFAQVVEEYKAESIVILYYNQETQEYLFTIPNQIVSHSSVSYDRSTVSDECLPIGTIHSHCNFNAFHSGVDTHDEEDWDGLHITFGHNNLLYFSVVASIVVNGQRKLIDPLSILEGLEHIGGNFYKFPEDIVPSYDPELLRDGWMSVVKEWNDDSQS